MYIVTLTLGVCLLAGCTLSEPPPPPTAPAAEDLSTWTVPEMVPAPAPPRPKPPPPPEKPAPPTPAEKVYKYVDGGVYTVPVSVGAYLAIVLPPGEQVRNATDGDLTPQGDGQHRRWQFKEMHRGVGETQSAHLVVTVAEPGLTNGLIITTLKRTYHVTLESVAASKVRVLRWTYDPEPVEVVDVAPVPAGPLPPPDTEARYHVGYQLTSTRQPAPTWSPRQIVDDGRKTYLLLPEVTLFETVPLVRLIGPNGPQVVNVRQFLNVLIIDQLIARAELRVGVGEQAEVVTIQRGNLRTIHCPADGADCPQWPAAARTRMRSTS
jgi:type IV secretory pathway VirB9-like protein